ncbi:hypothetical protein ACUODF_48100, partial [Escherichia coli]
MALITTKNTAAETQVGNSAAEADNPEQSIPKATNQVIYRILIF